MLPNLDVKLDILILVFRSKVGKNSPVIKKIIMYEAEEKHRLIKTKIVPALSLATKQQKYLIMKNSNGFPDKLVIGCELVILQATLAIGCWSFLILASRSQRCIAFYKLLCGESSAVNSNYKVQVHPNFANPGSRSSLLSFQG